MPLSDGNWLARFVLYCLQWTRACVCMLKRRGTTTGVSGRRPDYLLDYELSNNSTQNRFLRDWRSCGFEFRRNSTTWAPRPSYHNLSPICDKCFGGEGRMSNEAAWTVVAVRNGSVLPFLFFFNCLPAGSDEQVYGQQEADGRQGRRKPDAPVQKIEVRPEVGLQFLAESHVLPSSGCDGDGAH